jgi:hypothetical protein
LKIIKGALPTSVHWSLDKIAKKMPTEPKLE